jgi:hypothetical protein
MLAVTKRGGAVETSPQKKELCPLPGPEPAQTGELKVKVMLLPTLSAEANPTLPMPPVVTTKT